MERRILITTSWDDGSVYDLKLAKLLRRYEIPGTFYIPLSNFERKVLKPKDIIILSKEFEVGSHGLNHVALTRVGKVMAKREIEEGKRRLEEVVEKKVFSFAYPNGEVNQFVKQLAGMAGFKYARTTSLFAVRVGDKLLAPTTIHAYNHHPLIYFQHGLRRKLFYQLLKEKRFVLDWEKLAISSLNSCLESGGIFHLWGHSWEIEERGDWRKLERVLAYISRSTRKSDRVTNIEALKYLEAQKKVFYENYNPAAFKEAFKTPYYQAEQEVIRSLVKDFDRKGMEVLDVGCGIGRISELFGKADYKGVDLSKGFIEFAKKNHPERNKGFIVCDFADLERLGLGKQDLVIIWGMFEDEPDPFGAISSLKPLIKKGTRIIFTLHNAKNPIFALGQSLKTELLGQPFPYTSFSPNFLRESLKPFAKERGCRYKILSFGPIPPVKGFIPGFSVGDLGTTLVVVLDKIS